MALSWLLGTKVWPMEARKRFRHASVWRHKWALVADGSPVFLMLSRYSIILVVRPAKEPCAELCLITYLVVLSFILMDFFFAASVFDSSEEWIEKEVWSCCSMPSSGLYHVVWECVHTNRIIRGGMNIKAWMPARSPKCIHDTFLTLSVLLASFSILRSGWWWECYHVFTRLQLKKKKGLHEWGRQ